MGKYHILIGQCCISRSFSVIGIRRYVPLFQLVHYINTSVIKYTFIVYFFILCWEVHLNTNIYYTSGRFMCSEKQPPNFMCSEKQPPNFTFIHMGILALNYAKSSGILLLYKMQLYCNTNCSKYIHILMECSPWEWSVVTKTCKWQKEC